MACHSPWQESGMEEHDRNKPLGYTFVDRDAQPAGQAAASTKGWEKGASAHPLLYVPPHATWTISNSGMQKAPEERSPCLWAGLQLFARKKSRWQVVSFLLLFIFPLHSEPCPSIFPLQKGKVDPKPAKNARFWASVLECLSVSPIISSCHLEKNLTVPFEFQLAQKKNNFNQNWVASWLPRRQGAAGILQKCPVPHV